MIDWNAIRETHAPMIWSTVARILKDRDDSLDCCQDVFTEAFERSGRSPVADWGAFLRWLATRRAIDHLRRRNRGHIASEKAELVRNSTPSVEEHAAFNELVEVVRSQLAYLPDRQAEAFWLVCVEERTYDEVAQQMGVELNAVRVLVHRARKQLQAQLTSFNPKQ